MNFTAKHILLLGAGKSASTLIGYLKEQALLHNWQLTVADYVLWFAWLKVENHPNAKAVKLDIKDGPARRQLIESADVVISLMPPAYHLLVAQDCIELGKHLLTASYIDDAMKALEPEIRSKGLLFLCEMGLDPGIDHMSAMQLIHRINAAGGTIRSFKSHCGGLVAPESDNNPWHYKVSWNPRNVVLAGKAGAVWRENGVVKTLDYANMFRRCETVDIEGLGKLAWYPNRDSLSYIDTYQLQHADTFVRTTLRYPSFCKGWNWIVALRLTDEKLVYATEGMSLRKFLELHLQQHSLYFSVESVNDAEVKEQFRFLGFDSDEIIMKKDNCTAADVMYHLFNQKLWLEPADKDMVVMLHEIDYELNGKLHTIKSSLVVKGEDALYTAMAKTVGLPLGIATVLLLEGKLNERGLHIPTSPTIYEPVLEELKKQGISFKEKEFPSSDTHC